MRFHLPGNRYVLVDSVDLVRLQPYSWHLSGNGYVHAWVEGRKTLLHRYLLDAKKGQIVDHKNRNRLDCRRSNLRLCSYSENITNGVMRRNNTSGFRGVDWYKRRGLWRARIMKDKTQIYLGFFETAAAAAKVYKAAARKFHGNFVGQIKTA